MGKERVRYELRCPNPDCPYPGRYHYWLETFDRPEWEKCPICGWFAELERFLMENSNSEGGSMRSYIKKVVVDCLRQMPSACPECHSEELNFTINRDGRKITYYIGHPAHVSCKWSKFDTILMPLPKNG